VRACSPAYVQGDGEETLAAFVMVTSGIAFEAYAHLAGPRVASVLKFFVPMKQTFFLKNGHNKGMRGRLGIQRDF